MYKLPYSGPEVEERLAKLDTLNADDFDISEELQELYGLYGDDANVGAVLEALKRAKWYGKSSIFTGGAETTSSSILVFSTKFQDELNAINIDISNSRFYVSNKMSQVQIFLQFGYTGENRNSISLQLRKNGNNIEELMPSLPGSTGSSRVSKVCVQSLPFSVEKGDYIDIYTEISGSTSPTPKLSPFNFTLCALA